MTFGGVVELKQKSYAVISLSEWNEMLFKLGLYNKRVTISYHFYKPPSFKVCNINDRSIATII